MKSSHDSCELFYIMYGNNISLTTNHVPNLFFNNRLSHKNPLISVINSHSATFQLETEIICEAYQDLESRLNIYEPPQQLYATKISSLHVCNTVGHNLIVTFLASQTSKISALFAFMHSLLAFSNCFFRDINQRCQLLLNDFSSFSVQSQI